MEKEQKEQVVEEDVEQAGVGKHKERRWRNT